MPSFNIDRTEDIIGKQVFDTIGSCNKEQLEKWLSDIEYEIAMFERTATARRSRLLKEKQLIEYRLGVK